MASLTSKLAALLVCLGASLAARPAHAERTRLEYQAPPVCPNAEAFAERVRARGADLAAGTATGTLVLVSIREGEGGFNGSVRVETGGAPSTPRDVTSPRCEEVADGLAVVAAIALRENAEASSSALPNPAPSETASSAPAAPPTPAEPAAKPKADPRRLSTVGQWGDVSLKVDAGEVGVRSELAATLSGGAAYGLLPGTVLPRFDFSLTRANFITTPDDAGYIVGGIVRVRWSFVGPVSYRTAGYDMRFWAFKAGVGGCSQLRYDRDALVLLFCGEIAAGAADFSAKDAGGTETEGDAQGVGTAGFDFDARYNLSRHFHLGLSLGAEIWPTRMTARRPDGSELATTNFFLGYATLSVGLHF